jgi:hypothetical protein
VTFPTGKVTHLKHPSSVYLRPELLPLLSLLLRSLLLFLPEEERVAAEFCLLLLVELCERTVVLLLLVLVLELLLELVLELRCGLLTASRLLPVELCVRTELFRVSGVLLRVSGVLLRVSGVLLRVSGVLLRWLTADLLLADLLVVTSGRYTFTALLLTRVEVLPERLLVLSSRRTGAVLPVSRR